MNIVQNFESAATDAEERLPEPAAAGVRLKHAVVQRVLNTAERAGELLAGPSRRIGAVASDGARTVTDTARETAQRTLSVATTGLQRIRGEATTQAERTSEVAASGLRRVGAVTTAQAERTSEAVIEESTELAEESADRVQSSEHQAGTRHLESLTRAELYQRAQEENVPGRSGMSKSELIGALSATSS